VESDPTSRLSYAQRTVRRRAALDDMGWEGARSEASAPATQLPPRAGGGGAKRERKGAAAAQVRLPPDIRTELADKVSLIPSCMVCAAPTANACIMAAMQVFLLAQRR